MLNLLLADKAHMSKKARTILIGGVVNSDVCVPTTLWLLHLGFELMEIVHIVL